MRSALPMSLMLLVVGCDRSGPSHDRADIPASSAATERNGTWELSIVNPRGVIAGPLPRLVFDVARPPRIRICSSVGGRASAPVEQITVLWLGAVPVTGRVRGSSYHLGDSADCTFIETDWPTAPVVGDAQLNVRLEGADVQQPVRWVYTRETHPGLAVVVAEGERIDRLEPERQAPAREALLTKIQGTLPTAEPEAGFLLRMEHGRQLQRVGRRLDAVRELSEAADFALEATEPWRAVVALQTAAFYAMHISEPGYGDLVRRLVTRAEDILTRTGDVSRQGWNRYLSGWHFVRLGLVGQAVSVLADAERTGRDTGDRRLIWAAATHRSLALVAAGRFVEALESDVRLSREVNADARSAASILPGPERSLLIQNVEWNRMDAVEAGVLKRATLAEIRLVLDNLSEPDLASSHANLLIDRARAAWLDGDSALAGEHLRRARTLVPDGGGFDARYVDLLDAEISLEARAPHLAWATIETTVDLETGYGCDAYRGWALSIASRVMAQRGETNQALRLARASVAFGLGWQPLRLVDVDARPLNHERAFTHALELSLRYEGPEAALALIEDIRELDMLGQRVRQLLARLDDGPPGEVHRRNLVERVERACRQSASQEDPLAGSPVPVMRRFLGEHGGQGGDLADLPVSARLLPDDGAVVLSRSRIGGVWHGFRVDREGVVHAVLEGGRFPKTWVSATTGQLYFVEPAAVPKGTRVPPAPGHTWLPTVRSLAAKPELGSRPTTVVPEPACPARVDDPWTVMLVERPRAGRAIPLYELRSTPTRALIPTCGALDEHSAFQLALVLSSLGVQQVAVSPAIRPHEARSVVDAFAMSDVDPWSRRSTWRRFGLSPR